MDAPPISGDTLDYKLNKILIASHESKSGVQLYDYTKREFFAKVNHFNEKEVCLKDN